MKKIFVLLLTLLFLCSCQSVKREDFYIVSFDSDSIAVGYDNVDYLNLHLLFDQRETLSGYETVKDITFNRMGSFFGTGNITNFNKKEKGFNEGIITSLTVYLKDAGGTFAIDGNPVSHVSEACELISGEMIYEKTPVCKAEKQANEGTLVMYLFSDILNLDQDLIDRVSIDYFK